ncbi:MAG: hypothetical protein KJ077_40535 [Anaerolineae bacterium]|nr:hypothetical protein [Anaerolineae bacterium]
MVNTYYLEKYARMRHDEFLVEASQERWVRLVKSQQPSLSQRVRWQVGNWFVVWGYKLNPQSTWVACEQGGK